MDEPSPIDDAFAATAEGRVYYPGGSGYGYIVPDNLTDLRLRNLERRTRIAMLLSVMTLFLFMTPWYIDALILGVPLAVGSIAIRRATRSLQRSAVRRSWMQGFVARSIARSWESHAVTLIGSLAMLALGFALVLGSRRADSVVAAGWLAVWTIFLTGSVVAATIKYRTR